MNLTRLLAAGGAVLAVAGLWACQSADRFAAYRANDPLAIDRPPAYRLGPADDNHWCFVCHMDYQAEPLARRHSRAGVGCSHCHGESERHTADEDAVIPPEKMFARHEVNASCLPCHQRLSESHVVCLHQPGEPGEPVCMRAGTCQCTDCHGNHRLASRSRRWDPNSGELVWSARAAPAGAGSGMGDGDIGGM